MSKFHKRLLFMCVSVIAEKASTLIQTPDIEYKNIINVMQLIMSVQKNIKYLSIMMLKHISQVEKRCLMLNM